VQKDMIIPDFFVIGAAKSGTTALYEYLKQNDNIFLPDIKETNYFHFFDDSLEYTGPGDKDEICRFSLKTRDEYENAYKKGIGFVKGDVSPVYLYDNKVANRIYNANPNAKIIVVLREPVSRAISQYNHAVRQLRETLSFQDALEQEKNRLDDGYEFFWAYQKSGLYYEQLKSYYDVFPREQIKVIKYDDFISSQQGVMSDLFDFLNVEDKEISMSKSYNSAGKPKLENIHKITRLNIVKDIYHKCLPKWIKNIIRNLYYRMNMKKNDIVGEEIKAKLKFQFRDDILKLEELTGKTFKEWR
tara:strand:- start:4764 stop:5666 length:903 start_codon:yes stop_codon:yes gene_type:complete